MKTLSLTILMASLLSIAGCGSVYKVEKVTDSEDALGLYYNLPRNEVEVELPVTISTIKRGRYQNYKDACKVDGDFRYDDTVRALDANGEWPPIVSRNISPASMNLLAFADPDQRYRIDLSQPVNPFASKSMNITLNGNQLVSEYSATATDSSADFALSIIDTAVDVAAIAAAGTRGAVKATACDPEPTLAVTNLSTMRSNLQNLYAGTTNLPDSGNELYDKMKKDLEGEIDRYHGYFIGERSVRSYPVKVVFDPDLCIGASVCNYFLFDSDLNPQTNLTPTAPRGRQFQVSGSTSAINTDGYYLQVTPNRITGGAETSGGFVYRAPGKATLAILRRANSQTSTISIAELPIAQYGVTKAIPKRFGLLKSEITELKLDPLVGSITTLKVNGTSLGGDQVDQINETISTSLQDDTIARLQRHKDELQLRKDIADLQGDSGDEE